MTTLTLAAALALAAQCGGGLDQYMLVGQAKVESGLDPSAIHLNKNGTRDYGLMGINESNFSWLGLTPETALDPCTSIRAGVAVLTARSRYNTGDPQRGIASGYAATVAASVRQIRATGAPSATPATVPLQPTIRLHDQIASFAK